MAYADIHALAFDESNDLHKKAAVAVAVAARDVIGEDSGTPNHANRLTWAKWLAAKPQRINAEAHRSMIYLLGDGTVATGGNATADADVQSAIDTLVNWLAKGGYR